MSETQWPHFLSPFCSFSSCSCLKAPLREMRAKTFTPSSLLWSLILAVFLPEKMRCATRLINCWNFLFHYQSWLHCVLFVLSPGLSACLSVVYYLFPLSFNLDFIFSFLSFALFLYVSFFRKVNNTCSSLTSIPYSKPLIISSSPRTRQIVLKGQLSDFPPLCVWEEGRENLKLVPRMMQTLPFTPATMCPTTPAPTYTYVIIYYAKYFWLKLTLKRLKKLLYQLYTVWIHVVQMLFSRLLCIRVCDVRVNAVFSAGSYDEGKYQDVGNYINDDNDDGINYHSENYETLDTLHSRCLRLTLTYLLASITLKLTCSCNISQEQNK